MALSMVLTTFAEGEKPGQITTVPSPAISTKALEVKISTSDFGSEVYCYTWCKDINGSEKAPSWSWDGVHTAKFKMTGNNGSYSLKIENIKEFYELTDAELQGLNTLGFIAKTPSGQQTVDLVVNVEQGRREVYGGGEGTASDPFILSTKEHLAEFASSTQDWGPDVYVKLTNDLDAYVLNNPIGNKSNPYQGHFDGGDHVLREVLLQSDVLGEPLGIFGVVKGAEIKSLGIKNSHVSGMNNVGMLVGTAESGLIEKCFVEGNVIGRSICVGGLVGENVNATISDCYAAVHVNNTGNYAAGGFVGKNRGTIKNVYATGGVLGKDYIGGIVGANYGTIRNSVALNLEVTGEHEYAARFGGNNNERNQSVSNHSWDSISSSADQWPIHGDHATTKPSSELSSFESFKTLTNWDFDNVWEWKTDPSSYSYPVLRNLPYQTNTIPEEFFRTSGVEEIIEANGVNIIAGPNPFEDYILVTSSAPLLTVEIYSVSGMKAGIVKCNGETEVNVDMSSASSGVYIVMAVTESGSKSTFKLIKK